jgi:hypothetical protein
MPLSYTMQRCRSGLLLHSFHRRLPTKLRTPARGPETGFAEIGAHRHFQAHDTSPKPTSSPLGASLPRADWIAQSLLAAAPQMP